METKNPLNQNPEEAEKPMKEENSPENSITEGTEKKKPAPKKKPAKAKKAVEKPKDPATSESGKEQPDDINPQEEMDKQEVPAEPAADTVVEEAPEASKPVEESTEESGGSGNEPENKQADENIPQEEKGTDEVPAETAAVSDSAKTSEAGKSVEEGPEGSDGSGTEPVAEQEENAVEEEKPEPEAQEAPEAEKATEEAPVTDNAKAAAAPPEEEKKAGDDMEDLGDDQDEGEDEDEEQDEEDEDLQVNYNDLGLVELVSTLEQIVQEEEMSSLRKKVALIKVAFLRKHTSKLQEDLENIAGKDEEEEDGAVVEDDLERRFNQAFHVYSEKRKQFLEKQEEEKQQNLDAKKLILEELKALIESEESLKKTYDDFKELQDKWKAIGLVPKSEVNNLWQSYHFYVEKFFDKVKINKELRDLDLKKNLELKIELCEKAEELLLETSILKSFKQLQQYHKQWKEIGPVPQDKKDELWERFKSATEKINLGRREHYNKLKEEQENNLVSKTALCEKAEEILHRENNSIKEWQENTREISELLKVWKTIGPAPRKENDEIWDRFKTSLDTFFAGKKEYFQTIKDEQLNNYNLKLDLCAQAESMKDSTDWKQTTRDLIDLQKEWKKIGPVPRKHSDKVWQRFRAACDEFFNSKSEYFAHRKTNETDNLKAKEELIKQVETYEFGKDKSENLDVLKEFQRTFTEIGHVPFKEKDRIQNAFRSTINKKLDELKISKAEMQTITYKQRFDNIQENPNANRIVRNERHFLVQKMKKLEEEIQLLENNMGFLAKSKKADLLKAEFMKKIENSRTEVAVIKEKLKFLERETE